ncbi:alpha/beta hydrolase [Aliirhizobium terrae]|uniref:alpha/beta hydrolase n=1 Tax=Terrirhizobium terrae TaxID=2926709 RepID=UPI00336A7FFE
MPEVIFNGPAGRLEGRYQPSQEKSAPIAIILHPHPQFGGTMNNQIVYQLFYMFQKRGFTTLRFNFRGIGRSQGEFDHGAGELSDAASALDWVQSLHPDSKSCWVAGYSFGAWIGMQLLMRRPEIEGFMSIAPQPNTYDFSFLAPCPSSGLIINGDLGQGCAREGRERPRREAEDAEGHSDHAQDRGERQPLLQRPGRNADGRMRGLSRPSPERRTGAGTRRKADPLSASRLFDGSFC